MAEGTSLSMSCRYFGVVARSGLQAGGRRRLTILSRPASLPVENAWACAGSVLGEALIRSVSKRHLNFGGPGILSCCPYF